MNRAGNVTVPSARVSLTSPVSIGWRMPCRTELLNSDSSSRKSTPLCASVISPGRIGDPPPTSPASDAEWWGLRNGRTPDRIAAIDSPATEWIRAVSSASSCERGGKSEGSREASMVLPDPGGPIMSIPCLPAAAICRARLATSCPATSRKSRSHAALSGTRGESKGKSAAARIPPRNRRPYWASPSTLTVSPSSAHTSEQPLFLAHNAKASEPATPRTKPSSESSPTNRRFSMQARSICPVAAKRATAMGRSRPEPVFLRELGARLTTILSLGIWNPLDRRAARTRSRASWTEASPMPTIEKPGSPFDTATSTSTGIASTPRSVAPSTVHRPYITNQPRTRRYGGE